MSSQEPPGTFGRPNNSALARAFGAVAEQYSRLRPGYPAAAIDVILGSIRPPATVLDLAAGTGQLTGDLCDRGFRVIAVEPSAGMARQLRIRRPAALLARGVAERIPLPDGAVDAVIVGQAFHWFAAEQALAEMARVSRSGGRTGLLWNSYDPEDELAMGLQHQVRELVGRKFPGGDSVSTSEPDSPFGTSTEFGDVTRTTVRWAERRTIGEFQELFGTFSWISTAPAAVRAQVDELIAGRLAERPADQQGRVAIGHICQVWSATRVPR